MISILMATFNGEKFIAEQIDSVLNQSVKEFKLIIRDDASTDNTFTIAKTYAKKHPDKITAIQNKKNSGSSKYNFIGMMTEIKDEYIMLCDQDDVWLPDKIEKTLAKITELEQKHGKDTPLLVHTDLTVVDANLNVVSKSFKKAMNANYKKTKLRNQVIQNTLTGCTAMYNRALAMLLDTTPGYMIMHDWWLILTAAAFGKIKAIDGQTVLYRQHTENEIGAKDVRTVRYKLDRVRHSNDVREAINITYKQAKSFLEIYSDRLSEPQRHLLTLYADIPNHNKIVRIYRIFRLGTHKNGFSRRVAHLMYI